MPVDVSTGIVFYNKLNTKNVNQLTPIVNPLNIVTQIKTAMYSTNIFLGFGQ